MNTLKNIEDQIIKMIETKSLGNGCGKISIDQDGVFIEAYYNMYPDYCSIEIETALRVIDEELEEYKELYIDEKYIVDRLYQDIEDAQALEDTEYLLSMSF